MPYGLPSARAISNKIYQSDMIPDGTILTAIHMTFGQILDHDMDLSPVVKFMTKDGKFQTISKFD